MHLGMAAAAAEAAAKAGAALQRTTIVVLLSLAAAAVLTHRSKVSDATCVSFACAHSCVNRKAQCCPFCLVCVRPNDVQK